MTIASARSMSRPGRIFGAVMVLAAMLVSFGGLAPQADAAKQKRVVALSPFAASAMVKMGARPVAIGATIGGARRLDPRLRNVRSLPLSHPNGPNLEVMAKLKPDLVFSSTRWAKGTKALQSLGIRVVYADPTAIGQVNPTVTKIGKWLGKQKQANNLKRSIQNRIRTATKGLPPSRPKVLVVLGIGNTAMAFLGNSWGGQIIQKAGGRLVTGGVGNRSGGFVKLSDEVVVAQNPDIIIVVPHGNTDDLSEVADYIKNNEAWKTTNAIQNDKVYVSVDNELLQSGTDVGQIIGSARSKWLRNW
ncbi:MAG: ABC transporter substrate-binding protein [Solirubrobacterales bacterium]|nr:ABC transporter substrate-binding protein [Solirubrobacterales bacterium]